MPDHVHLLFELGGRLSLDRVVAKWKASVRRAVVGCKWQANYFEHRLCPGEPAESYAWYVFMNPYKAGLISVDEVWPGWWRDAPVRWDFLQAARSGLCPQPQWMDEFEEKVRGLVTGE